MNALRAIERSSTSPAPATSAELVDAGELAALQTSESIGNIEQSAVLQMSSDGVATDSGVHPVSNAIERSRKWGVGRAFTVPGLDALERVVLALVLTYARGELAAVVYMRELARRAGCELRSVERVLARLADRGLIVREVFFASTLGARAAHTPRVRIHLTLPDVASIFYVDGAFRGGLELEPSRRAVLAVYLAHANASREAWPSYARVAELAGVSVRTVATALEELEALGLVRRRRVPIGGPLPNGQRARTLRSVVRVFDAAIASSRGGVVPRIPRLICTDPPTLLQSPPDQVAEDQGSGSGSLKEIARVAAPCGAAVPAAEVSAAPMAPRAVSPIGDESESRLLLEFQEKLETDDVGADAETILAARRADGFSALDFSDAIAGVALTPWRMDLRSKRTVRAVFGTLPKFKTFRELGRRARGAVDHVEIELLEPAAPAAPAISLEERRELAAKASAFTSKLSRPSFLSARRPVDCSR